MDERIKVGITQGDINGIGYEVIIKTLADARITELCTPIIYGSSKVLSFHRKVMDLEPVNLSIINDAQAAGHNRVNLINITEADLKVDLSVPTPEAGQAAYLALEKATKDLKAGLIDVLLTAPINKHSIQSKEFTFPGHTEYLEQCSSNNEKSLMILLQNNFRVALATGHVPLSSVASQLSVEKIVEKLTVFNHSLQQDFTIIKPRIAVLSLNPHAGEEGLLGKEEENIIIPALQEADKQGILCFGPFAADGFFGSGYYTQFDGILAMYHDQGLIPFKTLSMEEGVNYTAGLSIIRTSPAHGTAYDIAGKNAASEASFRNALYLALDVHRNRKAYVEAKANPLKKQYFERGSDNEKLDLTADN